MAIDPGVGARIVATVTGLKGSCSAGHRVGDTFEISCHDAHGLCGFFYYRIFAELQTFQFGGKMPWWDEDTLDVECPDSGSLMTMTLRRYPRT